MDFLKKLVDSFTNFFKTTTPVVSVEDAQITKAAEVEVVGTVAEIKVAKPKKAPAKKAATKKEVVKEAKAPAKKAPAKKKPALKIEK